MLTSEPQPGAISRSTTPLGEERPPYPSLDPPPGSREAASQSADPTVAPGLDFVLDVPVRLSVELGRTEIPIRDVVNIGRGAIIELDGVPGAPLDVRVNGVLIGRGEVVVVNEERLGLRFVEVVSQSERASQLR